MWGVNQPRGPAETWPDKMIPSFALGSQNSLLGTDLREMVRLSALVPPVKNWLPKILFSKSSYLYQRDKGAHPKSAI